MAAQVRWQAAVIGLLPLASHALISASRRTHLTPMTVNHRFHSRVAWSLTLTACLGALASLNAQKPAPTSDEELITLPEFQVSTEKADRYRASDTISAARTRGQLVDTGLSINVISKELIEDLGANSMYDVTRYFSGTSNGRGAGPGGILDRQNFRGFESFSRTIDGLSTFQIPGNNGFTANFEPNFIERIEVVKGPDSILSPTGSPGGSINVITKSPSFHRENSFTAEVGNYNADKYTIDSTGALIADKLAFRLIADYQHTQTYLPGALHVWDVSPQLTYQFSNTSKLTLKYFGTQWETKGAIANANDNGWYVVDPTSVGGATISDTPPAYSGFTYDGWNGSTHWSHRMDRVNIGTAEFTTVLFNRVSMRLAGSVQYDVFNQDVGYPTASAPASTYDPATGQVTSIASFDPTNVKAGAQHVRNSNRNEQVQNDYATNFNVKGVSLAPVTGWTYQQGTAFPNFNKSASLPAINLFLPYDPPRPDESAYTYSARARAHAWQYQVYALNKAGFYEDRLMITAGVSRLWTRSTSYNLLKNTVTDLTGKKDTYLGGLVAKPAKNVSLYYTFSTNAAITSNNNQPIWQSGKQHEFGAKSEFFNQALSFTAAHFQIVQNNLTSPNPAFNIDPAHNPSTILTNQTSHGFEFDLQGRLTKHLSVIASLTEMKLRDSFGRPQRNIPGNLANLLLNYHFTQGVLKNLSVFAGAVHMGKTPGETVTGFVSGTNTPQQPGFYVAAWTVYNAGASYTWDRLRFNLNVDNVLDDKFVWQPAGRISVSPYPGLTARFSTTLKF